MTVTAIREHAALIVVDLQQGTLAQNLTTPAEQILTHAATLVDAFRAGGRPVVLVTAHSMPAGLNEYGGGPRQMPEGWDTPAPQIAQQPGDIVISKSAWSAFTGTDLHRRLTDLGVTQTVIIGLATSFGVESTARTAYDLGYDVVIASDAVADLSQEAHHSSLTRVFPVLAQIGTTREITGLIQA
ncbi:isochorismatase family cysteine hydrolase [Kineosporia sp. NBRC 101731]|uniref:isochorismatase family cysteine hydrolase n=1 Tax=Kineosporia sp. NBRC 101731 TaxID=3032199 RepID=UPI0024A4F5B1|nr:isochorismatase family cysteine hydrolase [Kineosporia sp. NBRC 101731]GLY29615.1 hydrolase [Kineosporia sp. NBRC 101731]